jgi:hypothetical protein
VSGDVQAGDRRLEAVQRECGQTDTGFERTAVKFAQQDTGYLFLLGQFKLSGRQRSKCVPEDDSYHVAGALVVSVVEPELEPEPEPELAPEP